MKILIQIALIFALYWISQFIEYLLPIPFPASVISIILLLVLLLTKVIKLKQIEETSDLLVNNLTFLLLPMSVGCINYIDVIVENGAAFLTICTVSLLLSFGATAWTVQIVSRLMHKEEQK